MSDAPVHGKSYGEIVSHAFRKNRGARVALWISVFMLVIAILTPLLANDRPLLCRGTLPGDYRKSYTQLTRGAFFALLGLPGRLAAETARFEKSEASLNEFLRRLTQAEAEAIFDTLEKLRKRAEALPDIRGRWISRDVTLREMLETMAPDERPLFEAARVRILRDLPAAYAESLSEALLTVRRKLGDLTNQLDPPFSAKSREIEAQFRAAVAGDYLSTKGERRPQLQAALDAVKAAFEPEKAVLVPKVRTPALDSFTALDVFFVAATLLALVAFGPLTWWRLKRVAPLERRWLVSWTIAILPAAALALAWAALHEARFETVSYKAGVEDGSMTLSWSAWPPLRYRYDEVPEDSSERLVAPSAKHLLGTDFMGRDLLARMMWGSRISLSIGFVATAIAVAIGIVLGALAGFYRGWVDIALSRFIEWMICFPRFFLVLAVVAFLPPSIYYVMLVLGLFGWMGIARLQRGEFYRLAHLDFVASARAMGASNTRVMFRHLLPNAIAPVLVAASFGIASAMLTESALSFLGFGVQEPATSWGQILFTARDQVPQGFRKWWIFTIPGAAIFVAVTCYNLVGDGIRDAVDPRLKT